jgi:hypothetical protein
VQVIGRSNAGKALDPRGSVRERCPTREKRETSDHKSDQPSSTVSRMPMTVGASLRSRVPPKWHARFCSRGGGSDPSIDCNRAHRFGVLWRKRSQGTCSEKGNRWVERVLSLYHTCRIRGRPTFPLLVDAVSCLFKGEMPDLSWRTQHESRPVSSTP